LLLVFLFGCGAFLVVWFEADMLIVLTDAFPGLFDCKIDCCCRAREKFVEHPGRIHVAALLADG